MFHQYLGWLGSFLFATCAVPQVIHTWKTKKSDGMSWLFLLFWFFGEILTLTYIIIDDLQKNIFHWPLYCNYVFNIILLFYLIYAKIKYK